MKATEKRAEFGDLSFDEVSAKALKEPAVPSGKPKYWDQPWTQLRDEMSSAGAKKVSDLGEARGDVFYQSTGSVYTSVAKALGLPGPGEGSAGED